MKDKRTFTKAHILFEQSGTFKTEFSKLGIPAEDYDIQNDFGETDHVIDLFREIEACFDGRESIFDSIKKTDIVMAFFPCIYFSCMSQMAISFGNYNLRGKSIREKADSVLERARNREYYFSVAVKMYSIFAERGIPFIMENPWSKHSFLKSNFVAPPTIVDNDRTRRGDVFRKPTAYFFLNLAPTHGYTHTQTKKEDIKTVKSCKQAKHVGQCSKERSMITPLYARNFICDFILGKGQEHTQLTLF